MRTHEVYQKLPDPLIDDMLSFLREEERDAYKTTLASLAANKRLRPVFVQRKSVPQQFAWLRDNLRLKTSNDVSEHLIQVWLMTKQPDMLTQFLDAMGIEHDENGEVEGDLPDTLDSKKLTKAVDTLLKKHPADHVSLYLHAFHLQNPEGWPELTEIISSHDALQFGANNAEPPAAEDSTPPEEPPPPEEPTPVEASTPEEEPTPDKEPTPPEA
ncbi:MAG: hypothetical protein AAF591_22645 [Verrucomicrobiota bacterium]